MALERLDAIRIRRLNASRSDLAEDDAWSWHLRLGLERGPWLPSDQRRADDPYADRLYGIARFGLGIAGEMSRLTAFAMLDGALRTGPWPLAVEPNVGLLIQAGRWRGLVQASMRYDIKPQNGQASWSVQGRYQIAQHRSLHLEAAHERAMRLTIAWRQYL